MTNVTWSSGAGARSYITTLTSSRGHAKCHTLDTHCLMGCITCGTNYSVNLEAISSTGHTSECRYRGFSSSEEKYSKQYSRSSLKMENHVDTCSYRSLLSNEPQALSYGQQHPEGAVALHGPSDTQPHGGSVRYRSKLHLHRSRWHQALRHPGGNMWGGLQSCGGTGGAEWGQSELLSTQDLLG